MSVKTVRDVLVSVVGEQVGHWEPNKNWKDRYAVYGETGAPVGLSADDEAAELILTGEIYYYTTTEFDETVDLLCVELGRAGVSCGITNIGYDENLKQIQYQIHWEVPCGAGEIYR